MLPELSRGVRLALMLSLSVGYVAYHGISHAVFAKGPDDGGGGDDDDDTGDDKPPSDTGGDDDDDDVDKDQPPVTAGGLFTINTYPVREIGRPLTMTQRITQLKVSIGTDLSAKGAFGSGGLSLEAVHGIKDNFSIIGGLTDAYNFKQFSVYFGFEGALAYDFLDIRLAANLHRFAVPFFCNNGDPNQPTTCDASSTGLPDGNFQSGLTQFSVDIGFPFRYPFTPEVAVVALQTLMTIDFNAAIRGDPNKRPMGAPAYCSGVGVDAMGNPIPADTNSMDHSPTNCIENGAKPDLNPSIGIAANPVPPLSVVIFGQLRIPDFDTSAGNFQIPVTARVEFSPNQKFDVGLEFTLLNVKPPDPQSPIDNRFLSGFVQARF